MKKKVSIIIPCYMVEQYIDRCMNSLLNQTIGLEHLELILVNDASPDHTLDKLLHYEAKYPDSILVINSDTNLKQGGARNLGLNYASADYIGYVDPDDWTEVTMFEKLYNKAISYDCDVVTCECKRVFSEGTSMGKTGANDSFYIIKDIPSRADLLISGIGNGGVWSKLYKRSFLADNNIYFPEHLSYEDNFFGYLVQMHCTRLYFLEEYLYHYFVNYNSTIVKANSPHHYDRLTIELMKLEELKTRGLFEPYYAENEFNFLSTYYFNTLHIIFTRFIHVPVDIVNQMRQEVLRHFPGYDKNIYLDQFLPETYKMLMYTIPTPLNQEEWDTIASVYR
ncbi:MAG TPA: glycosyltransferase [Clostridiales bacterium]|nr:glycosyltransferase [Clostridiales bacterium]